MNAVISVLVVMFVCFFVLIGFVLYKRRFGFRLVELGAASGGLDSQGFTRYIFTGKISMNYCRFINKEETLCRTLYPLFNKKIVPAPNSKYIYGGKTIIIAKDEKGKYIDVGVAFDQTTMEGVNMKMSLVPENRRHQQFLISKELESEFAEKQTWFQNPMIVAIIFALLIIGASVAWWWISAKYFGAQYGALQDNTNAIMELAKTLGAKAGVAPPA